MTRDAFDLRTPCRKAICLLLEICCLFVHNPRHQYIYLLPCHCEFSSDVSLVILFASLLYSVQSFIICLVFSSFIYFRKLSIVCLELSEMYVGRVCWWVLAAACLHTTFWKNFFLEKKFTLFLSPFVFLFMRRCKMPSVCASHCWFVQFSFCCLLLCLIFVATFLSYANLLVIECREVKKVGTS